MASAAPRRRKLIGQRRRVEDEGEDEGGLDGLDHDDDSITDGSLTDDNDLADDSDTSNIDEASPHPRMREGRPMALLSMPVMVTSRDPAPAPGRTASL
ncbi:hypothetical protein SNK05_003385 [Fusarium graminearum]